jgi:hypothetical protein
MMAAEAADADRGGPKFCVFGHRLNVSAFSAILVILGYRATDDKRALESI